MKVKMSIKGAEVDIIVIQVISYRNVQVCEYTQTSDAHTHFVV